jgi:uncharacterized protein YuzE
MVSQSYLQVTYRAGRPLAAYYYLPRRPGQKSHKSREAGTGLVIDYARNGQPIGIEITAPSVVTLPAINRVLKELGFPPLKRAELKPLRAAS